MKIIEDYADIEDEALKLINTKKDFNTNKGYGLRFEGDTEENSNYRKNTNKFNYFDYYKAKGFNLRNEVAKERSLTDFFKQKYKVESIGLGEDKLMQIIGKNPSQTTKINSFIPFNDNSDPDNFKKYGNPTLIVNYMKFIDPNK